MPIESLHQQVSSRLVISGRNWRKICQQVLSRFGISEACCMPLLITARLGDGVRQVQLAQAVGIEGASLVRPLDQLCAAGLIERSEDAGDRRAKVITLTPAGKALCATLEAELVELRRKVLQDLPEADLAAALRVFQAFDQFSVQ